MISASNGRSVLSKQGIFMCQKTTILGPFEMYHNPRNTVHLQSLKKKDTSYKYPKAMKSGKQTSQTSEITKYCKLPLKSDPPPPPRQLYTHLSVNKNTSHYEPAPKYKSTSKWVIPEKINTPPTDGVLF